jgi:parallel beta-helix repeat protein
MLILTILTNTLSLAFNVPQTKAEPKTWIVDDDAPCDFHSIKEAIGAAANGDTIIVRDGHYTEAGIDISKSLKIIAEGVVIVDGSNVDYQIFYICANDVEISGFILINVNDWCVNLVRSSRMIISNNVIENCTYGIRLYYSSNNTIIQNIIRSYGVGIDLDDSNFNNLIKNNQIESEWEGIDIWWSEGNLIIDNKLIAKDVKEGCKISLGLGANRNFVNRNVCNGISVKGKGNIISENEIFDGFGISVSGSDHIISNNTIERCSDGVALSSVTNCSIKGNFITKCSDGIDIYDSSSINITGNMIINSTFAGIDLIKSSNCYIVRNIIDNSSYWGIEISDSPLNVIMENNVLNTRGSVLGTPVGIGIDIYSSSNNLICHNNFINNLKNADVFNECMNIWDNSYPSGGNYWSDYVGVDEKSGPNQDLPGSDGIGDVPYIINEKNVDRYPLMKPYQIPITPPPSKTYILHVKSYPITGIQISYSGDFSGTGMTNFDIGPKNSSFTVTLTTPLTHQDYTFDHWELDGVDYGNSATLTVKIDDQKRERTVVAVYSKTTTQPSFLISVSPHVRRILPGESTTYDLTIASYNGFTGSISLNGSVEPSIGGISLKFDPLIINLQSGASVQAKLFIDTSATVALNFYIITLSGICEDGTISVGVGLDVTSLESIVMIGSIETTYKRSEFQGECAYVWVCLLHRGSNPHEVSLLASTDATGWIISPLNVKVRLLPTTDLMSNKYSFNWAAFLINFTTQASSGNFTVSVEKTNLKEKVKLNIASVHEKTSYITLFKSFSYIDLPYLYFLMVPAEINRVKEFATEVLSIYGLAESSSDEEKAKAIFDFVRNHIRLAMNPKLLVPKIDDIVKEIKSNGGATGNHRIEGECKTCVVFFGGLAWVVGLKVRVIAGSTEFSPPWGHVWLEVKLNDKWVFVDPTDGYFSDSINDIKYRLPPNLSHISFDPKKTYELDPYTGGTLFALSYGGGVDFLDLTSEYRYDSSVVPSSAIVLFTQSPVDLYLYKENSELIGKGQPYAFSWLPLNWTEIFNHEREGQFIILNAEALPSKCFIKLIGTGNGDYSLYVVSFNATGINIENINGTVTAGQLIKLELRLSPYIELIPAKIEEIPWWIQNQNAIIGASICIIILLTVSAILIKKRKNISQQR